ncbi:hypothetical protein AAFG13_31275 [Bradyrhizobium sp. B124]|uniref:hypothetical protein n=1 Tax=Bradyrhizobium sp. B124 TaxID=3140245 RepID=UPI00318435E2
MFARKGVFSSIGRAATLATVAAVALTVVEPTMAFAGSAPAGKAAAVTTSHGTTSATDISARRRYYRGGGGGAAAAAVFAGIVGTGLAIAATQNRRDYYDSYGYDSGPGYYGGPAYYGGGPAYYGGGPYYGYHGYYGHRSALPYTPY